jgi:hypothetical protein
VILLDSDVLLIQLRYKRDPKFGVNQQALQQPQQDKTPCGVTLQALLEVVGVLSFGTAKADIPQLPADVTNQYGLVVIPDVQQSPEYAGCTVAELMVQMSQQMSLGDAVQAAQIARYASRAHGLLTWNSKHFVGKVVIPVLTPQEWLNQRLSGTP